MATKLYPTQAEVPEAIRATAIETKEGKWAVEETDPALGEAGAKALKTERDARKAEKDRADAAERERDELKRTADAAEKGITKEALDKIRSDEAAARKPLEDQIAALKATNRKLSLTDRLTAKLLAAGVMKDRVAKALKDIEGSRVDLTDDGADFVVKDAKGNVTSETLDDFLGKTYKAESPFFYEGTNASGSGAEGGDAAGTDGGKAAAVASGKAAAAEQKKSATENALAFK
jgi:hypothetical protein